MPNQPTAVQNSSAEKAILIGLELTARARPASGDSLATSAEESLDELVTLAVSAGAEVVLQSLQRRPAAEAATLIGSGRLQQLAEEAEALQADVVIFDHELTPTQQRNIEKAVPAKVIDRTQLILDIFARRARTREGQLQVELAQLRYLLPRLTGMGTALSRLGGGIGTRGPGETKLETDRRRISMRVAKLEKDLDAVRRGRSVQRKQRRSVPLATIALVGYTNAGKSTLFNRLTSAAVLADARMFATLDPTVRHALLPSKRRVLFSDTVGFIRNLPTTLVKAFRATLEEVTEAALLLHVVDASSPHMMEHARQVAAVLQEIGAAETQQVLVLNKVDLLDQNEPLAEVAARLRAELGAATNAQRTLTVSARDGLNLDAVLAAVDELLPLDPVERVTFRYPVGEGAIANLLHEHAGVISRTMDGTDEIVVADAPLSVRQRLQQYLTGDPVAS